MSTDSNDLIPLIPAYFLINKTLNLLADFDLTYLPESRLFRIANLSNPFTTAFLEKMEQRISELQQRTKWKRPFEQLKESTLVLIKDENLPHSSRVWDA